VAGYWRSLPNRDVSNRTRVEVWLGDGRLGLTLGFGRASPLCSKDLRLDCAAGPEKSTCSAKHLRPPWNAYSTRCDTAFTAASGSRTGRRLVTRAPSMGLRLLGPTGREAVSPPMSKSLPPVRIVHNRTVPVSAV